MRRAAVSLILVIAAFALVSAAISRWAPPRDRGGLAFKLRYFEKHKDSFDVLFFGSSMVMRSVMPRVFDDALRKRGHRIRSFNFALGGMTPHEANAAVREVLAMKPKRLRYVVVELMAWSPDLLPNEFTGRAIEWHDWRETVSVLRTVALSEGSVPSRLGLAWMHLLHFGAHVLPVGRLSNVRSRQEPEQLAGRFASVKQLRKDAGFLPYPERVLTRAGAYPRRRAFLKDRGGYEDAVDALRVDGADEAADHAIVHYNVQALREQVETIRRAGAVPVHLVTPTSVYDAERRAVSGGGLAPATLAFDDPDAYPELYDPNKRYDAHHLLTEGAEHFSRLLATRFADELIEPARAAPVPSAR